MPTWGYSLETQNTSSGKVPEDKRGIDTPVQNPPQIRVLSRAPGMTKDQCPLSHAQVQLGIQTWGHSEGQMG